MFNLHKVKKTT